MKNTLYALISRLGYNIENKKNKYNKLIEPLKKFNVTENFHLLVLAKQYIFNLNRKHDDLSIKNYNSGFLISFSELNIYVESLEEFHILHEVFVNDDYYYTTGNKSVLIDIGANIGITSLFFSKFDYIDKIYAFEPIKDTYEQAQHNFSLNKEICKVETIKNIGLGKNNREEIYFFDKNTKGNTGVRGKLSPSYAENINATERNVIICDATMEIEKILNVTNQKKIIVKMDCEGAEYEILENLSESGMIKNIDVLLLEWHDKGSEIIENILLSSGFEYFSKKYSIATGMIYAFRKEL